MIKPIRLWGAKYPNGVIDHASLRYTRRDCKQSFLSDWADPVAAEKWAKKHGVRFVKVDVTITEVVK